MTLTCLLTKGIFKWFHLQIRRLCMPLAVMMAAAAEMKFTSSTAVIPFKPADGQSQKQP